MFAIYHNQCYFVGVYSLFDPALLENSALSQDFWFIHVPPFCVCVCVFLGFYNQSNQLKTTTCSPCHRKHSSHMDLLRDSIWTSIRINLSYGINSGKFASHFQLSTQYSMRMIAQPTKLAFNFIVSQRKLYRP
jgi:hypothetical protein